MQTLPDGSVRLEIKEYEFLMLQLSTLQTSARAYINSSVTCSQSYAVLVKEKADLYDMLLKYVTATSPVVIPPVIVPAPPVPIVTAPPEPKQPVPTGIIFEDDFSSAGLGKRLRGIPVWINGSEDAPDPRANGRSSDIFVKLDERGGYSVRAFYAATPHPLGDARPQLNFELGGQYPELWASYEVYIPQNYAHRVPQDSPNNKFFIIDNVKGSMYLDFESWPRGDGSDRMSFQHSINRVSQGHRFPAKDWTLGAPEDRGKWHKYVLRLRVSSSPTANDGLVQVWKNGSQVMDFQGLKNYTPEANYLSAGYLFGAANSGFVEDTELRLADIKFSALPLPLL